MAAIPMKDVIDALVSAESFSFREWPNELVPIGAGVYTIWEGDSFVYVGMSGKGADASQIAEAKRAGRTKMLRERLGSHASGRRSGDQFCVYVADRLVLPRLSSAEIEAISSGTEAFDSFVKAYIRESLAYRFVETVDGVTAAELEETVRRGLTILGRPFLNPKREA